MINEYNGYAGRPEPRSGSHAMTAQQWEALAQLERTGHVAHVYTTVPTPATLRYMFMIEPDTDRSQERSVAWRELDAFIAEMTGATRDMPVLSVDYRFAFDGRTVLHDGKTFARGESKPLAVRAALAKLHKTACRADSGSCAG